MREMPRFGLPEEKHQFESSAGNSDEGEHWGDTCTKVSSTLAGLADVNFHI